jgi:hypothetical protein
MWTTPLKSNFEPLSHNSLASSTEDKYVTVCCRLKPLLINEEKSNMSVTKETNSITFNTSQSLSKSYKFDHIFDDSICQDKFVHHICSPIVEFFKRGG